MPIGEIAALPADLLAILQEEAEEAAVGPGVAGFAPGDRRQRQPHLTGTRMLDHIFLTVSDLARSVAFYEAVLSEVGITVRHDYNGKDGPPGHPTSRASVRRAGCSSGSARAPPRRGGSCGLRR
jgi:hypothetical protein